MFDDIGPVLFVKIYKDEQDRYMLGFPPNTEDNVAQFGEYYGRLRPFHGPQQDLVLSGSYEYEAEHFLAIPPGREIILPVFIVGQGRVCLIGPDQTNNFVVIDLLGSPAYPGSPGAVDTRRIVIYKPEHFPGSPGESVAQFLGKTTDFPNLLKHLEDDEVIKMLMQIPPNKDANYAEGAILSTLHNLASDFPVGGRDKLFNILNKMLIDKPNKQALNLVEDLMQDIMASMPHTEKNVTKLSPIIEKLIEIDNEDEGILEFDYAAYFDDLKSEVKEKKGYKA